MKRWLVLALLLFSAAQAQAQNDRLPDITIWRDKLFDNTIDTSTLPGRTLLRLSTGTPNIGIGRLELRGGTVTGPDTQVVNQRIYRDNNTYWERPCGEFTYHASHGHIHFNEWCVYRLRAITANNGVGDIIATGRKTSFCILDLSVHNTSNPGFRNPGYYSGCGSTVQGLTPGWADIYSRTLTDQWIDITGVPNGTYWLEAEVDPNGLILEADESNNVDRIQVTIGQPPNAQADLYEPNETRAQVDGRPKGTTNSPNLGTVNTVRVIQNLSIHTTSDNDYFKFRLNNVGTSGDYVKIEPTTSSDSDIDMALFNASGQQLATSASATNTETISLNGRAAGMYYVRVFSYRGTLAGYKFTIDPSNNRTPSISVAAPNSTIWVERAYETFRVEWQASDPDQDPTQVALFRCANNQNLTKSDGMIPGYEALNGADGATNVNTAEMPVGTWYIFARVTDGGATAGTYASGRIILYRKGDLDWNNNLDHEDYEMFIKELEFWGDLDTTVEVMGVQRLLDFDRDGDVDMEDLDEFYHHTHE